MTGITGYGAYVPRYRLSRTEIAAAVGENATGSRAVAGHDEDSTTMAVESGRVATANADSRVDSVWFATTAPGYVEKTNATAVHAALGLPESVGAYDLGAGVRGGAAALLAASRGHGLALLSDVRGGHLGGSEERSVGDAAAAFAFGDIGVLAELVGFGSVSAEFVDRWRAPGEVGARTWEERFGEREYTRLAEHVVTNVCKDAGIAEDEIAAVAATGPNPRAVKSVTASLRSRTGGRTEGTDLTNLIGNTGAAQVGLALTDALDRAQPGELLLIVSLADGADALLLRATDRIADRGRPTLRERLTDGREIPYPTYLLWRGRAEREPDRRPAPVRPSAPFAARNAAFKFGFVGGRCRDCGTVQFPASRICLRCGALDGFEAVPAAGQQARIVTFTADRLTPSPSPPVVSAVLDLVSGGRVQCELTEVAAEDAAVGALVVLTFRLLRTVDGIRNYFWKARPITSAEAAEG